MKRILFIHTILALHLLQVSNATEFYTIIGPDGRAMVVQQKNKNQSKIPVAIKKVPVVEKAQAQIQPSPLLKAAPTSSQPALVTQNEPLQSVVTVESVPTQPVVSTAQIPPNETQVPQVQAPVQSISRSDLLNAEEYIHNEYLEEREFNLEGKKRFYAMPEGVVDGKLGSTRMQMVEREKGVGQSVLQSLFKREAQLQTENALVLSTYYHRVAKDAVIEGLGQACFQGKKIKKAKVLDLKDSVNLWPRASLNGEFDFEVVKLKQPVQNVQIRSYASRHDQPTFYWPFAVFLDEKACVIEGAGGFKNQDYQSNNLQHETVEGVIQVPEIAHYLLLTPLASAIDLDNRLLSNQGQLKLNVIR